MTTRIAVRAIIMHQDKLLCVRLTRSDTRSKGDFWCLPGGGLDDGEALVAGLEREMVEETGVMPKVGNLLYVQQFRDDGVTNLEFFFHVTNAQDYLNVDTSTTTHGLDEIAAIDFIDPSTSYVLPDFLRTAPLADQIAGGGATEVINLLDE